MSKKLRARNEGGVSPVVAAILMIAITVVLAAVLYVSPGLDDMQYTPPPSPEGSIKIGILNSTSANITFGMFSHTLAPMDIMVIISNRSEAVEIELRFTGIPNADTVSMNATGSIRATYTDLNYIGNSVNAGDYIIVDGLEANTEYSVFVFHFPSDNLCLLNGDTTFTLEK